MSRDALLYCSRHPSEQVRAITRDTGQPLCFACDPRCRLRENCIGLLRASNRYAISLDAYACAAGPNAPYAANIRSFVQNKSHVVYVRRRAGCGGGGGDCPRSGAPRRRLPAIWNCPRCTSDPRLCSDPPRFCSIECAGVLPTLCAMMAGKRYRKQGHPRPSPVE